MPHVLLQSSLFDTIKFSIWRVLSLICVDTFGLRMMYPGTVIQNLISKKKEKLIFIKFLFRNLKFFFNFKAHALQDGRAKLIEQKKAQRAYIQTSDSSRNKIDTLFVDQRNTIRYNPNKNINTLGSDSNSAFSENNGKYLVICCDGNASFYEIGCFQIPIENGYSALGWNYPGFGQSTVRLI